MPASKVLVLIACANQGICFAIARQVASSDKFHLLGGARAASKAEDVVQQLQSDEVDKSALAPNTIDVPDDASITAAVQVVLNSWETSKSLSTKPASAGAPTPSNYADRRIVFATFRLGQISMAGKWDYAFNARAWFARDCRSSKAVLNMITATFSVKLADGNITVIAAAPGFCRNKFTGRQGKREASDGASVIVRAATEGNPEELSRTFVADEGFGSGW